VVSLSPNLLWRTHLTFKQVSVAVSRVGFGLVVGHPIFADCLDGLDTRPASAAHHFVAHSQVDRASLIPRPTVAAAACAIVAEWHREKPATLRRIARERFKLKSQRIDNAISHSLNIAGAQKTDRFRIRESGRGRGQLAGRPAGTLGYQTNRQRLYRAVLG
jgi:hypothetical protein